MATEREIQGGDWGDLLHARVAQMAITRGSAGTDGSPSTPSGSLSPRWTGWLMGFPDGWLN
jgi:hypothetical protein